MYDLLALALYATIMTGTAVVLGITTYVLAKRLPDTMYGVGMAIRDRSMVDFGLEGVIANVNQGGRPPEGLGGVIGVAERIGLLDIIMNRLKGGVPGGSTSTYSPGLR